jgi:predicted signal transduction protein with EAL and GGDEF domain
LGGDEFSILIRRADEAQVRALAEDILDLANQEVTVGEHLIKSGISIGVAFFPRDGMDAATLLANADAALYRAKQGGRRSIRVFDAAMDQEIREKWSLVQQLRTAVSRNEFLLHFQPQLRIGHEIVGFEALLRWQHPIRGMLRPDLFIPLAEESGAILEIGEWALRSACEEASRWSSDFRVSVNLSPVQFRVGNIVRSVHQALIDTGISPRRLQLEITESVFIDDFERALSILRQLKNIGATIAMDDFGTGYSSLSYLQSFPFDRIKIDRQFVSQLPSNPQSATIVRAIVGLAKGLGLPVTAEGVETREQLEFLQNEGCDEAQGYLIGRPQPSSAYGTMAQGLDPTQSLAAR